MEGDIKKIYDYSDNNRKNTIANNNSYSVNDFGKKIQSTAKNLLSILLINGQHFYCNNFFMFPDCI